MAPMSHKALVLAFALGLTLLLILFGGAACDTESGEPATTAPATRPDTTETEADEDDPGEDGEADGTDDADIPNGAANGEDEREAAAEADLTVETVATGLDVPWEMRFLPNGDLLVTERGGRVVRVSPSSGEVDEVARLDVTEAGESGLLGMDLDPDFPDQPYVYIAYTHDSGSGLSLRLSRFTLADGAAGGAELEDERVLLDDIPAGRIHDGSRVAFGPEGYLWMTTGDAGRSELAQREDSLAGKVLRMNADGTPAPGNLRRESRIFTLGHRNPQGLDFHPDTGTAFVTEHGPDHGDEVNRLRPGANYGWPEVAGPGGGESFEDPIVSWTPTIAPGGAVFYDADVIPGWQDSFLFVTLKDADLRRLVPAVDDFAEVAEEAVLFDGDFGRLRAARVGPDGLLYLATSNRDGRGRPGPEDDRILRVSFSE